VEVCRPVTGERMTTKQFVGRELRIARDAKGITRAKLAARFPVSESTVKWWETGRTVPRADYIPQLVEWLDLPGTVVRAIDDLASKEVAPEWLGKWAGLERKASSILTFVPLVIPGLMQTPEYARAVLRLGKEAAIDLDAQVDERIKRQYVLNREDPPPPLYHTIMDEAVIRRPVGGAKTMSDQLLHVIELAQRELVIVQILPFEVGEHAGTAGASFELASHDGTEVAYVDNTRRGDVIELPEDVAAIRRVWQKLSAKACREDQSLEMIKEAAERWMT
jgi:transcriptional regulator with XRE-family HTH domain